MSSQKMTIKQRLTLFVAVVVSLQVVVAAFVFFKLSSTENHIKGVAERDIPAITALAQSVEYQLQQRIAYNRAFRFAIEAQADPKYSGRYEAQKSEFLSTGEKVGEQFQNIEQFLSAAALKGSPEEQQMFKQTNTKLGELAQRHSQWEAKVQEAFVALNAGNIAQAEAIDETIGAEGQSLSLYADQLLRDIEVFTEEAVHSIEAQAVLLEVIVVAAAFVAALVSIVISRIILARIYDGLNKVSDALHVQAEGDFSHVTVIDEPGIIGELQKNLEGTRQSTNKMIAKVAQDVSAAIAVLEQAADAVKFNSDAQSGEIMQVATAVNEMSATAQEIASNASQTQQATEEASGKSSECQRVNSEAVSQTQRLIESLTQSSAALTELEKNSANITSVLDVIKGIAEQTNLLALNAAIEAARAGEQGRGFAVVADEVRSLAQRTHDSTSEIETMIAQLTGVTKEAVDTMQKSCEMGDRTISLSHQSADYLNQASQATSVVTDMNLLVASAAEEQSGVVEEININVNKISEMAEESASQVDSLLAATHRLTDIAQNLRQSVGLAA